MDRIKYFLELAKSDRSLSESDKEELQSILLNLREKYDEGDPLISDTDYDILAELAIYEGEIRSSSESTSYGSRVKHPIDIMRGTLDKIYYLREDESRTNKSRKSLQEWIAATQEKLAPYGIDLMEEEVLLTAKYDGMSCCLYVDGKGNPLWLTRGDTTSNEGVDIGHIMNCMTNIPLVPNTATQFELLIPNDKLQELNERYSTSYKNTRALTAGIIRTKDVDYRAQFIVPIPLKLYQKGKLTIHPDQISKYPSTKCTLRDVDVIQSFADHNRNVHGKFRTDGVVITLTNPQVQKILGRKDNINQFEVAYKFTEESAYSTVKDIYYQVSEFGTVTPVLIIQPIQMKGNTINRISLHNKTRFDDLNLKFNDHVKVLYDIIPCCVVDDYCLQLNKLNPSPYIRVPDMCPECGKPLDLSQPIVSCTNKNCPSVKIGRLINYLENLNCKGIGPETVKVLYDIGVVSDIPSLYHIGSTKQSRVIMDTNGFGQLKLNMILSRIKQISTLFDYEFFSAMGYKGLNRQFFISVFSVYPMDTFLSDIQEQHWDVIYDKVRSIHGVGDAKAKILKKSLKADRPLILRCIKYIKLKSSYGSDLDKPGVVFTGFRSDELKQQLESIGYQVQDNVTQSTKYVVAKDLSANTGSMKKAAKKNIPIISIAQAKEIISNGKPNQ